MLDKHNIDTKTNLDPKNDKTKALETDDNSQLTESDQVWNQNLKIILVKKIKIQLQKSLKQLTKNSWLISNFELFRN